MSRMTVPELQIARLELNTPAGFAISKGVVRELVDEVLELREFAVRAKAAIEKADAMEALFVAVFQENLQTTAAYRAERVKVKL